MEHKRNEGYVIVSINLVEISFHFQFWQDTSVNYRIKFRGTLCGRKRIIMWTIYGRKSKLHNILSNQLFNPYDRKIYIYMRVLLKNLVKLIDLFTFCFRQNYLVINQIATTKHTNVQMYEYIFTNFHFNSLEMLYLCLFFENELRVPWPPTQTGPVHPFF